VRRIGLFVPNSSTLLRALRISTLRLAITFAKAITADVASPSIFWVFATRVVQAVLIAGIVIVTFALVLLLLLLMSLDFFLFDWDMDIG
jgi:hypothetical protein